MPEEPYAIPFAEANFVREGDDVTIVALGRMVLIAEQAAAAQLEGEGISCEIVDPRTTSPLDLGDDPRERREHRPPGRGRRGQPALRVRGRHRRAGRAGGLRRPEGGAADGHPAAQPGALQPGARGRLRARRPRRSPPPSARRRAPPRRHDATTSQKLGMPKWGLSMTEGRVVEWLVEEGAEVAVGDEVAEVETEKINGAVECAGGRRAAPARGRRGRRRSRSAGCSAWWPAPRSPTPTIDAFVAEFQASFVPGEAEEDAGPAPETVKVGAGTLRYLRQGDGGEPVVLLHGFGGDLNNWLFAAPALAERPHRLRARPARPRRLVEGRRAPATSTSLADAVQQFLDCQGLERVHLVGHSLGGLVAASSALRDPGRARSLTLVASAGLGERDQRRLHRRVHRGRAAGASSSPCCSGCSPTRAWSPARSSTTS